jgi:hypothetical protein
MVEVNVREQDRSNVRDGGAPLIEIAPQFIKSGRRAGIQQGKLLPTIHQAARDVSIPIAVLEVNSYV